MMSKTDPNLSLDLADTLVVAISSTALFDLAEADRLYYEHAARDRIRALEVYRAYMLEREQVILEPGTGLPLVRALMALNRHCRDGEPPITEVVVMSRNSPETGIRVLNTIRALDLGISRSVFTSGRSVVDYLEAFNVDLFMTTNVSDAQRVIDERVCAAAIVKKPPTADAIPPESQVRIAFDGDAVLFDESSELVYKTRGLEAFQENEDGARHIPLPEGPYAMLLKKLGRIQHRLRRDIEDPPVRIAIVTSRGSPADMRVINTLRHWGMDVDEAFFLGGVDKSPILEAFRPHIFFDDQDVHLDRAAELVPSGKVPYPSDSPLARKLAMKEPADE